MRRSMRADRGMVRGGLVKRPVNVLASRRCPVSPARRFVRVSPVAPVRPAVWDRVRASVDLMRPGPA